MANLLSTTIRGWLGSKLFTSGFMGSGWRINKQNGRYKFEIDDIVVRNTMTVFELIIQKIRAVKGALAITQANGKVKSVDWNRDKDYAFLEIEDEMSFVEHDFIRCQSFANNTLHSYWVVVSEIVDNEIKILKSEFAGVIPKEGDELVQFGNESHDPKYAGRHSAIYLHADESGMPAIDVLENIYSKSFEGCLKVRLGGDLPGANGMFGLHCVNGMLKGTDDIGNLLYCIYPDGTAEFGCKSAMFKPDRSGHIAGGAISWTYDKNKEMYVCKLAANVVLSWENLDEETKRKLKGEDGKDAIIYKLRTSSSFIPIDADGKTKVNYINVELYRTVGDGTPELCPEKCAIFYTIYQGDSSALSMTPQNTAQIQTYTGENAGENPIDKVRISANIGTGSNQKTVDMITLEAVHDGFNADWLKGWDTNKTKIGADYFISPKLFSGINEGTAEIPILTGIIQGKDCLEIKGIKHSGIFAVVKNEIIFSLDPERKEYEFKGRVEVTEGKISIADGKILLNEDGSGQLSNGRISWDKDGNVDVCGKFSSNLDGYKIIIDPDTRSIRMEDSQKRDALSINYSTYNGIASSIISLTRMSTGKDWVSRTWITPDRIDIIDANTADMIKITAHNIEIYKNGTLSQTIG